MKITLLFGRTECDNLEMTWTGIKRVDVEIPDNIPLVYDKSNPWRQYHLIGMVEQETDNDKL